MKNQQKYKATLRTMQGRIVQKRLKRAGKVALSKQTQGSQRQKKSVDTDYRESPKGKRWPNNKNDFKANLKHCGDKFMKKL